MLLLEALLPERYKQLPERTDRLEEALIRLAEQSAETDRRLRELAEETNKRFQETATRVDDLTIRIYRLVERVDAMQKDLAEPKGFHLEQYYRTNATAILGLFFRRLRVMDKSGSRFRR